MTDSEGDGALPSLLEVVAQDLEERRHAALAEADERARDMVHGARATARQRVHRAVEQERTRMREEVERGTAIHAIRARERRQEALQGMLERAWSELPSVLRARWADPEARRRWAEGVLGEARRRMTRGPVEVEHPPGWDGAPVAAALEALERWSGEPVRFKTDAEMEAGLRVHAQGAVLDGSLAGLLADRRVVEGRLLSELLGGEGSS